MPSRAELVLRADALGLDPDNYPNDSKLEQKVIYLEKNASTMAGTLASGTLTQSGAGTDGDQIKIGDITYTYVTALSEATASSTLTVTDVFSDGEIVAVEGKAYVMRTALSNPEVENEVLIGASAAASLDNLKSAINGTGTAGTDYSSNTVAHSLVTATTNSDTTQEVAASDGAGTYANTYLTSTTGANASWDGASFADGTAGVDPVQYEVLLTGAAATELDNLKQAINAGDTENGLDGEGTNWSTGTRAHPQVTATTNGATTQVVAAREMAVGEDISTTDPTDDGSVLSWGATTLASGVADQNAVDASAAAATSGGANV